MYTSPLAVHVCTSKPMILNEYHTTSSSADNDVSKFFIPTGKGTKKDTNVKIS
jgi:hypothetical protein